ncbi:MAG: adenylosuccinate lyase [Gammaproteobacteria bacterium]|nr:MAG: adenylosuccinate lyase [Gammaproteobacteria bacterium]
MDLSPLTAISPLDGRYAEKLSACRELFSEYGLLRLRCLVEIRWLQFLADRPEIDGIGPLSPVVKQFLNGLAEDFGPEEARRIKALEATTNHDVKAVEYYLAERFSDDGELARLRPFLHFACTSEDINNIAYALMLRRGRDELLLPALRELETQLRVMAGRYAELPMLSRTHGQPASPTTLGKELANFCARLERQLRLFAEVPALAKINGAVGNFNAHLAAYPDVDWLALSGDFLASLGLEPNLYTTQIEPHDWIAEYCDALSRIDSVLLDASRDCWAYISIGYFRQRRVADEVGSSTMPHKVNPIDFENAEGNLGLANALCRHFADKLPLSRWQRDLSDSTVLRNLGVACGHALLACQSLRRGLDKLEADPERMAADLDSSWEVLGEAVQTVMRRHGHADAYERLKQLTRGERVGPERLREFVAGLDLPAAAKARLLALTPADYTGLAARLATELARGRR